MNKLILTLGLSVAAIAPAFSAAEIDYAFVEGEYTTGNSVYFYHYADVDSSNPTYFQAVPAGMYDLQPSYTYYRFNTNGTFTSLGTISNSSWYSDSATAAGGAMVLSAASAGSNMLGVADPDNGLDGLRADQYRQTQYKDIYITFVITGDESLDIMFRGISSSFNAKLSLYGSSGLITSNTLWSSNNWVTVEDIHDQLGLTMFDWSSQDACILRSLSPGTYTIQLQSESGYGAGQLDMYVY